MLNSLSSRRTKEMAPESGFMYSRHESFTTSQLQNTHTHTHTQSSSILQISIYCRETFSFKRKKGVGSKWPWGCGRMSRAFQTCGILFLCVCLQKKTTIENCSCNNLAEMKRGTNRQTGRRKKEREREREAGVCQCSREELNK